jgi:hypothetical protein
MPNPPNLGYVGPVSALIDNNNVLTVSWVPPTGPAYTNWEIILNGNPTASIPAPSPYTGTPLFYTTTLTAGSWTMDMLTNIAGSPPQSFDWEAYNSTLNVWQSVAPPTGSYLAFPDAIPSADVVFSSLTLELGQPLTLTLQSAYTGADQWQVLWPDGSNTGWLPLSASLLTKQFSISGPLDVVIQSRRLYNTSSNSPAVILMRQLTVQIFVVDQQYTGTTTTSSSLTGTLGIGGQQGFEITGATGVGSVANPWEVAARAIVRDTVTNELKLLVATTRFSNASSLLGTMGIDVFPIEGRPKIKELIQPVYENSFNSLTSSVPVNITTTQLPTSIYVGKPMAEFQMQASGGTTPYAWYTDGLPDGLKLSINGVLSGTPLALGTASINFAVQDSSVPFYIAEAAFPITISTDLLVELALGQTDANGNPLSQLGNSLGIAKIDAPYSVQMIVGNVNPANPIPGGLPPYTWSIPAGSLPIGLSINPNTGLISGTPSTYNSTSDFGKTFSAVIQVTDAIGAIATQTYQITLEPAVLQFGNLSQPTIYADQQFKLTIPIFGGFSPYSITAAGSGFFPAGGTSAYYGPVTLVDGQIQVDVNYPIAGSYSFIVIAQDSPSPIGYVPVTLAQQVTRQFTVVVEAALSDPFLVPAFVGHVWGYADTQVNGGYKATPIAITGDFAGFTLGGVFVSLNSAAPAFGGNTLYTGTLGFCSGGGNNAYLGKTFVVSGFQNPTNNGTFLCTASDTTHLTLNNPNGVAETIPALGYSSFLTTAIPTPLPAGSTGTPASPVAPFALTTLYTGTVLGGANNALVGQDFIVSGFAPLSGNNGTFYCVGSTAATLTLSNPNGTNVTVPSTAYSLISAISGSGAGSLVTVELGSAANYALLAYSGITNADPATSISGGVIGSAPIMSITGFNPPTATVDNADAPAARLDGNAAFGYYSGLTPTQSSLNNLSTNNGGGGVGVYRAGIFSGGALDMPTSITLDAQGNANAVFVFISASTTQLQSGASILLLNGAQAANVVWVVGSSFTQFGTAGTMVGTILAYASITLGGGTLNGRALAVGGGNGAVTIAAAEAITVSAGAGSPSTTIYTADLGTFSPSLSGNFTVSGFDYTGNNGTFAIVSNTSSQLILANPNGSPTLDSIGSPPIAIGTATQVAIAVQSAAKALQATALSNGITVAIDPVIPEVEFSGPPSGVYGNVQYMVPLLLQLAGTTVATTSQVYTVLTHDDATLLGWVTGTDIGTISTVTRPYVVGEVVGLNPRQPYYNSPDVPQITPTSPVPSDAPWIATMPITVSGNALPLGLSLDANTGLIYGTLTGVATGPSVIQYVGAMGIIHGTVTITWNTVVSAFSPIDNLQDSVPLGTILNRTSNTSYIAVPAGVTPASASIYYIRGAAQGALPAGLTLDSTPTGQNFYITGAATESGYFDVWFQVTANTGTAYLYHRISIDFTAPLTIVTTSLPSISQQAYSAQTQGFGGVPPYTWSAVFPAGAAGLSISPSTGIISGTLSSFPVISPTDFDNVAITLTDFRGSTTTAQLDLTYNNSLRLTTNRIATITDDLNGYSFQMTAAGGIAPYTTWAEIGTLPTGITFNGSTGLFSGVYSGATGLSFPITIAVTDSTPLTTAPIPFTITTGGLSGSINDSGVGPIPRGEAYQGTLSTACMTTPVQWQVAPTTGYPNLLPSGLSLQVNGTGATATIAGIYSGPIILPTSPYPVRVIAVDSLGDTAEAIVEFSTDTNLTIIGWDYALSPIGVQPFPLPNAVITGSYPPPSGGGIQLVAIHGVPSGVLANGYNQYVWNTIPSGQFPFNGISLSSTGVLSGAATTLFSQSFDFVVSDSLTPPNTAPPVTTTFASQTSALVITTSSLPQATAGVVYNGTGFQLQQTGAVGSFTFSVVGGTLPSGLSLSPTGLITGTTLQVGSTPITFRVTDSTSAYFNRTLTFTVISGLALKTGIDYEDSTAYGYIGYVDTGNVVGIAPRTNLSFYVVATGVITTDPAALGIIVSGGFGVGTVTISGGVAKIPLTGAFSSGTIGNVNPISISVTDSGITATATFNWVVYNDGVLRLVANNAFPVKLTTPN